MTVEDIKAIKEKKIYCHLCGKSISKEEIKQQSIDYNFSYDEEQINNYFFWDCTKCLTKEQAS